jgi:hypothetical protein
MVAWAVSFVTIGFCKICYTLISGLAAIAMAYTEPNDCDTIIASMVLVESESDSVKHGLKTKRLKKSRPKQ